MERNGRNLQLSLATKPPRRQVVWYPVSPCSGSKYRGRISPLSVEEGWANRSFNSQYQHVPQIMSFTLLDIISKLNINSNNSICGFMLCFSFVVLVKGTLFPKLSTDHFVFTLDSKLPHLKSAARRNPASAPSTPFSRPPVPTQLLWLGSCPWGELADSSLCFCAPVTWNCFVARGTHHFQKGDAPNQKLWRTKG